MHVPNANPILVQSTFDDIDDLSTQAQGWDFDFRQLDCGKFRGEIFQGLVGRMMLGEGRFERVLHQRGSAPPGMRTIGIPADNNLQILWRGKPVFRGDLLVFPKSGELDSVSQTDFHVYTISLPEDLLGGAAESAEISSISSALESERIVCKRQAIEQLRARLRCLVDSAKDDATFLTQPNVVRELEGQLLNACTAAIANGRAGCGHRRVRRREQLRRNAEAFIAENESRPLTVGDVCKAIDVSERTLQYVFLEHFSVTPKKYLMAVRLNGVRRELREASSRGEKIVHVAGRWGFWHMGQFAADYRRQFGELPSQTLGRKRF